MTHFSLSIYFKFYRPAELKRLKVFTQTEFYRNRNAQKDSCAGGIAVRGKFKSNVANWVRLLISTARWLNCEKLISTASNSNKRIVNRKNFCGFHVEALWKEQPTVTELANALGTVTIATYFSPNRLTSLSTFNRIFGEQTRAAALRYHLSSLRISK